MNETQIRLLALEEACAAICLCCKSGVPLDGIYHISQINGQESPCQAHEIRAIMPAPLKNPDSDTPVD